MIILCLIFFVRSKQNAQNDSNIVLSRNFISFYGGFIYYNIKNFVDKNYRYGDAIPIKDSYDWQMGLDYNLKMSRMNKKIFMVAGLGYYQSSREYNFRGNNFFYNVYSDTIYKNSQNEIVIQQSYSTITYKEKIKNVFFNVGVKNFVEIGNSWGLFFSINHRLTFEMAYNTITTVTSWKTQDFYDTTFNKIRMGDVIFINKRSFESSNISRSLVISERYTFLIFQGGVFIQPIKTIRCLITPEINFFYLSSNNMLRFGLTVSVCY